MGKKTLMMIALAVVAVGLIGVKLGPLFMPRSWRMRRAAKKAGRPPPVFKKKEPKKKRAGRSSKPALSTSPSNAPVSQPSAGIEVSVIEGKISEVSRITAGEGVSNTGESKSPFMKYIPVEEEEEEEVAAAPIRITVSGILWDMETPLAIINKKICSVGDKIEDAMLVCEIHPEYVVLDGRSGKKIKVKVGE